MKKITYKQIEELKALPYLPDRILKIDIDYSMPDIMVRVTHRTVINTTAGIAEGPIVTTEYMLEEDK